MQMSGNTNLITGGGSGIGRALAEAFHALGNQVVIAGRRKQLLDETIAVNPGMKSSIFDIENPDAIRSFASQLTRDYPKLNAVVHNAGIMRVEDLKERRSGRRGGGDNHESAWPDPADIGAAPTASLPAAGYNYDRLVRPGICAHDNYTHLLRHQGGHSLVLAIASLSTPGDIGAGS